MPHQTKSFFDQAHPPKDSNQWHRPAPYRAALTESNPNSFAQKPPIPANTQAKSKLKAFHFVPTEDENGLMPKVHTSVESGAKKEGVACNTRMDSLATVEKSKPATKPESSDAAQTTPSAANVAVPLQIPPANTHLPSTPGTRISLEDLIGNSDNIVRLPPPVEESPEDQIGWIPNSSSTLLTPNRKRKRARSSSPSCPTTSSQRQPAYAFFPAEKTIPDDPMTTLWKNYATSKNVDEQKAPDLSDLLFVTSPKPLETPSKTAGLRRWASTGNDWPNSRTKRRRTDGVIENDSWRGRQGDSIGMGGKSKVAAMVERLQESLATQKLAQPTTRARTAPEGPSSSTPLPEIDVGDLAITAAPSLPPARRCASEKTSIRGAPPTRLQQNRPRQLMAEVPTEAKLQANCQDTVSPAPLYLQSKAPLPAFKRPNITRAVGGSGRRYPIAQAAAPLKPIIQSEDLDEFGDDFDLTIEDLDELETKPLLNRQPPRDVPRHPTTPPEQQQQHQQQQSSLAVKMGNANPVITLDDDDDDDEFGDVDLDVESLVQAEMNATHKFMVTPQKRGLKPRCSSRTVKCESPSSSLRDNKHNHGHFHRYRVKQIVEGQYTDERGYRFNEKVLMAESERSLHIMAITLRDSWAETPVFSGATIHVTQLTDRLSSARTQEPAGQMMLRDAEDSPFLIVHPDHMLSATTIADSFDCLRKAVLQDRIKATGETSRAMVYGKILHAIFQQALLANQWDSDFLVDLVRHTVENHLEGLWELGMTDTTLANEEIRAKMGEMEAWAKIFVVPEPSALSMVDDKRGERVRMSISKLIAIEEHIWSPRYGLKGNVDATVQCTLTDGPHESRKKLIAPFEVKTGRTTNSPAHKAQTALYTLLLSDRYDVSTEAGILYYLESSNMSRISPPSVELRQMIQQRNRLAAFLHRAKYPDGQSQTVPAASQPIEESGLPQMLNNPFKCGRCYARESCFSYHGLVEHGTAESAGMMDDKNKSHSLIWREAVGHLALSAQNQSQANRLRQWFTKWDRLLTFEEGNVVQLKIELWTMSSAEREKLGRCFGDLVITRDLSSTSTVVTSTTIDGIEGSGGKINRFAYSFSRARGPGGSFAEGTQLTVGEPVVVSSEKGQWALANGYVISASKHDIVVAVDRKLGDARQRLERFDAADNQVFRGIMTVDSRVDVDSPAVALMLYCLDKDEFSNGLALVRNNLVTLMSSHPIHTRLREQIVHGAAPNFKNDSTNPALAPSQIEHMNEDQMAAVVKVLGAEDYALILGMPGTGKTSTIAHIIGNLLAQDKSILLTSFTHTAVDNILLKIKDIAPPNSILRLGVPAKINAEVRKFCQLAATPRSTIDEIEEVYVKSKIVATTCMGTNHAIFNRRTFDVCIVDEASQITLPVSLGPLLHARKFVLVGDHYQLPPLVQNRKALEGGLDASLFRQLSEEHPESMAMLGRQYRMCEDIMALSNTLVYSGRLCCGNESVAKRSLQICHPGGLELFHTRVGGPGTCSGSESCWLKETTRSERRVVFANIDGLGDAALETLTSGKNITNTVEATLCAQTVLGLLALGVPGREIGVITLYRSQLALIRQLFKAAGISREVEIDSADRFQGRDKECILLSMVRSNRTGVVGDLLKDYRRVNVALTRARSKLIVLGSRNTLRSNDLLARFLKLVDERQWCLDLPQAADSCHVFDFSSQSTASLAPARAEQSPIKGVSGNETSSVRVGQEGGSAAGSQSKVLQNVTNSRLSDLKEMEMKKKKKMMMKSPRKVVNGKLERGSRVLMEQIAMDFFEDLTADDI